MEKRFWVFSYETYYPCGGMNDFLGSYDSTDEAYEAIRTCGCDLFQLLDSEAGTEHDSGNVRDVIKRLREPENSKKMTNQHIAIAVEQTQIKAKKEAAIENLKSEIKAISESWVCIEQNAGTFGAEECCRKTGSGEPRYGEYEIQICVGTGSKRVVGCDPQKAPGQPRRSKEQLKKQQASLKDLRSQLRSLET